MTSAARGQARLALGAACAAPVSTEVPLAGLARPDDGVARPGAAPGTVLDQAFDAGTLHLLRAAVLAHAASAGMPGRRAADVMLAVHELASNAVRHGAGAGRLLMRAAGGTLRCQVDDGSVPSPDGQARADAATRRDTGGAGPADGWPYQPGHGLWLVRQVTDQMSVLSGPRGSRVTAVFALPAAGTPAAPPDRDGLPG